MREPEAGIRDQLARRVRAFADREPLFCWDALVFQTPLVLTILRFRKRVFHEDNSNSHAFVFVQARPVEFFLAETRVEPP